MSFMTTMMMIKAIAAVIIVTVSSFVFVAILGSHLGREVYTEDIEFSLAKEHVVNVFTEDGVTTKKSWDEFEMMEDPRFAMKVELGEESYISNSRLYEYGGLCSIDGAFIMCSPEFNDFYLVDGDLESAKLSVVIEIG